LASARSLSFIGSQQSDQAHTQLSHNRLNINHVRTGTCYGQAGTLLTQETAKIGSRICRHLAVHFVLQL